MEASLENKAKKYSSDEKNKVNRIQAIDAIRGFGMLLVILGHTDCSEVLHRWICSFHMPLFFIISGYISKSKQVSFKEKTEDGVKKYIIPYFMYCGIMFLIYGVFRGALKYGLSAELTNSLLTYMGGILYSRGSLLYMPLCTPLWYLTCFFCVTILVWIIDKYNFAIKVILISICLIAGWIMNYMEFDKLVWNLDTAFTGTVLYCFGRCLKLINEKYHIQRYILTILPMIVVGSVLAFANKSIPYVNFCDNRYGSYLLMFAAALPLCAGFILLFLRLNIDNKLLSYIGKNTICFLAFNYFARLIYNIISEKIIGIHFGTIVEFFSTVLLLLVITICVNRIKFSILGGRTK